MLTRGGGSLKHAMAPTDDEAISERHREGALVGEQVDAICVGPEEPTVLYLKRPR